jgi:hypothetical protein
VTGPERLVKQKHPSQNLSSILPSSPPFSDQIQVERHNFHTLESRPKLTMQNPLFDIEEDEDPAVKIELPPIDHKNYGIVSTALFRDVHKARVKQKHSRTLTRNFDFHEVS